MIVLLAFLGKKMKIFLGERQGNKDNAKPTVFKGKP